MKTSGENEYALLQKANEGEKVQSWSIKEDSFYKLFRFCDFLEAFPFILRISFLAEKMNHHPKIIQCYKNLEIYLFSYDEECLTEKDVYLAQKINLLEKEFLSVLLCNIE